MSILAEIDPALWAKVQAITWNPGAQLLDRYGVRWINLEGGSPGTFIPVDDIASPAQTGSDSGASGAPLLITVWAGSDALVQVPLNGVPNASESLQPSAYATTGVPITIGAGGAANVCFVDPPAFSAGEVHAGDAAGGFIMVGASNADGTEKLFLSVPNDVEFLSDTRRRILASELTGVNEQTGSDLSVIAGTGGRALWHSTAGGQFFLFSVVEFVVSGLVA